MTDQPIDPNEKITLPKRAQEEIEKKRQHAILIEQIKRDLQTNPRYRELFDRYEPESVKSFTDEYSWRKARYIDEGRQFIQHEERDFLRFETEGAKHLLDIQRKKLFDCECLWRAEQIRLPEVEQTYDFIHWRHHLEQCPFLSAITEDEVDAYVEYLLSDQFEEYPEMDYDSLRRGPESDSDDADNYPDWFAFYDMRFGTGSLHELPDIRGEKESFYLDLCHAEARRKYADEGKVSQPRDDRPRIGYHDLGFLETFIRRFEDGKLLRYFHAVENFNGRYADDDLEDAIDILVSAEEPVPVDAADNWKDAIIEAANRFRRQKLAGGVRAAYREYRMRLHNKVSLDNDEHDDTFDVLRRRMKEDIIKGRVLNGEPPDLNF